jgi:hypothetical protein
MELADMVQVALVALEVLVAVAVAVAVTAHHLEQAEQAEMAAY